MRQPAVVELIGEILRRHPGLEISFSGGNRALLLKFYHSESGRTFELAHRHYSDRIAPDATLCEVLRLMEREFMRGKD